MKRGAMLAAVVLAALVLGWWLLPAKVEIDETPPVVETQIQESTPTRRSFPKARESTRPQTSPLELAFDALADELGHTAVACPVGFDIPDDIRIKGVRAQLEENTLRAIVDTPSGSASIIRDWVDLDCERLEAREDRAALMECMDEQQAENQVSDRPIAMFHWEDGVCRIEPVSTVRVRGRVEGEPIYILVICGQPVELDDDRQFELDLPGPALCPVFVGPSGTVKTPLQTADSPWVIVVEPLPPPTGRRQSMEERLETLRQAIHEPLPEDRAAERMQNAEAARLLRYWASDEREKRQERYEDVVRTAERLANIRTPAEVLQDAKEAYENGEE